MITKIRSFIILLVAVAVGFTSCKKTKYEFGELKAPAGLALTATVTGADAGNPGGNGSGTVQITVTATNAINYKIDFGDGNTRMVPSGDITYKYASPGTYNYTITVNAIGTGGVISTISKRINVFVAFEIPVAITSALTNGASRVWVCDKETVGHFGVGPADAFTSIWYSADANSRLPCSYDDEVSFSKDANNNIFMEVNNFGQSFAIGASAAFYGLSSAEDCRDISTGGKKKLAFMDATSASTPSNSTRIQFTVPGNGLIIFGTGGTTYEIISLSATNMTIRNIGIDGNAWYQKLKVKP
ncbi:MAG: PKD domain-containing protein [Chitinophagaceae bacterium]|nr:PKD domain-containing protein [Chitinophagaceae bacterium]